MLYSDNEETMPSRKNNYKWLVQCINMINAYEEDARRQEVGGVIAALLYIMPKKRHYTKKKFWIAPLFNDRFRHGFFTASFPNLILEDLRFQNYFRMSATQFEDLLDMIAPRLIRQNVLRESISPPERLAITLRSVRATYLLIRLSNLIKYYIIRLSNLIKYINIV